MNEPAEDSGAGPAIDPKLVPRLSIDAYAPSAEDREKMRKALGIDELLKRAGKKPD